MSVFENASWDRDTITIAVSFAAGASEVERLGSWNWRVVGERVMLRESVAGSSCDTTALCSAPLM